VLNPKSTTFLDEGYLSIADNGGMSASLVVMAAEYATVDTYVSYGCYISGKRSGYEIRLADNHMVVIPVTSIMGP
jgi:hypothetical protein